MFSIDTMSRKVKRRTQGRTFGGVAACPHCSAPIRCFVTVVRTQCVLDVVSLAYSLPYVPLVEAEPGDAVYADPVVSAPGAKPVPLGTAEVGDVVATTSASAPVLAAENRGWDDDESPWPTSLGRQMVLR